ncbi:MAG: biotin transporter BioY [Blautia sp.]|uniref:biotin transporter BioY n=1 Tax=Blautia sp. TaxID=1955243 RepID=UPI002A802081|nr:biotin transporter BioY [Blautia sp.]MDY4115158.1 biotin transporter BioY [Blautia sp.]
MSQSYAKSPATERKFTTREMVLVGMFAAVLAVISPISLPMPTGVPITIQVFGVALVGAVLGSRLGTTATLVYVLLGAIGLLIVETIGGLQWHFVGGSMSIPAIAVYSLTAFIPKDIVITVLAVLIAIPIKKGINNAGNR